MLFRSWAIGIMGIIGILGTIGIIGILGMIGNRHNRGLIKRAGALALLLATLRRQPISTLGSRQRAFVHTKNIPTLHSGGISSSWSLLYEYLDFNGKMNGEMKFSPCMSMS